MRQERSSGSAIANLCLGWLAARKAGRGLDHNPLVPGNAASVSGHSDQLVHIGATQTSFPAANFPC
jgi:hypothetical protein